MAHSVMENMPPAPQYTFTPASPVVKKVIAGGKLITSRYYLHPKLGNAYRYKYLFENELWWFDVTLDGDSMHCWKGDGSSWLEGKAAAGGDADEDEE